MKLSDLFSLDAYGEELRQGYINVQVHPDYQGPAIDPLGHSPGLYIANYTQDTQFDWRWNEVTSQCRGLIFREDLTIVSRPFGKFFSMEQLSEQEVATWPWDKFYRVFDKVDGSLGIGYWTPDGEFGIATRGSFTSDQALHATALWEERYTGLEPNPHYTVLFEIVYPENRIVVDYGDLDDLILLAAVTTESGKSIGDPTFAFPVEAQGVIPMVNEDHGTPEELLAESADGREGFVFYWPHNETRLKLKFDEYKRLHAILSNANKRTVWRALKDDTLSELIELPDEFREIVQAYVDFLRDEYTTIEMTALNVYDHVRWLPTRKNQAIYLNTHEKDVAPIVFKLLDGKNVSDTIWSILEPPGESLWS